MSKVPGRFGCKTDGKAVVAKRTQTFTNGQVIYRAGAVSDRAFEVLSGAVELLGDGPDGEARVGVARAGDMFGEGGLIGGGSRETTARAVGAVTVRAILRENGDMEAAAEAAGSGLMSRLLERFGGRQKPPDAGEGDDGGTAAVKGPGSSSFIRRMMDSVQPLDGRIEVRLARLYGDDDRTQARHILAALDGYRDMRVKLVDATLALDLGKGLNAELSRAARAGRRLLRAQDADLLIWGHVPGPGAGPHLHFIARGDWDERLPGAFSFASDLPLPNSFPPAFGDLLHAVALAATRPKRGEQAALRKAMLPAVVAGAAHAVAEFPTGLSQRERAAMHLGLGNIHAALWAETRNIGHLERAREIYHGAITLLSDDEAAIDWAIAHKHLSAIAFILAEEGGDPSHYDEAAATALAALDTIDRDTYPLDWAALQYRLGAIHYKLGFESGDTDVLRSALHHHRNALQAYSRKHTPERWAEVMSAFGQAAQVFGEHVKSLEALATAVNACRAVLEVRDRRKTPLAWAAAQNNLGSALFLLGKKARNPERLELAIAAFERALAVYRKRDLHRLAAVTEKNLERARDMIEWYSPEGIPIVDLADTPLAELAARPGAASAPALASGKTVEIVE